MVNARANFRLPTDDYSIANTVGQALSCKKLPLPFKRFSGWRLLAAPRRPAPRKPRRHWALPALSSIQYLKYCMRSPVDQSRDGTSDAVLNQGRSEEAYADKKTPMDAFSIPSAQEAYQIGGGLPSYPIDGT